MDAVLKFAYLLIAPATMILVNMFIAWFQKRRSRQAQLPVPASTAHTAAARQDARRITIAF